MPGPHQKRPFHHDEAIPARIGKHAEQTGCENQERSFHCPVSRHPRENAPVFFLNRREAGQVRELREISQRDLNEQASSCWSLIPRKADAELIERCRGGDADAWDALFDKYYPVAARFVFQLSADFSHEDTEEICQETFLAVVRNLGIISRKEFFSNVAVAAWPRTRRWIFAEKVAPEKRGGNVVQFSLDGARRERAQIDPPSRCPGPDTVLVNAETSRLVRQSLDQLEDPCREIIELRYYGELSYGEIAAELRLNPKTVSSRLSKCLDRLCVIAKKSFHQNIYLPSNLRSHAARTEEAD